MNYGIIRYTLGLVLNIEAATMVLPLVCAFCYGDTERIKLFAVCVLICLLPGILLTLRKPARKAMYAKEGFIIVALSWIIISIFGAFPFYISGCIPSFIDALFESASGFTTTGASVLSDVEVVPKAILFWRSFTHWIGGMGVLVFLVSILSLADGSNVHLIKAESTGPAVSKLVPKVKSSAKILYLIYFGFTVIETVMLLAGGMSLFEALTMTFGTVGTGGFGVKNSSMADYSPYLQTVVTVFMILCGIDFSVYYLLLTKRFSAALKSDEYRAYLTIIAVSILLISVNCMHLFPDFLTSLRHGAFQVGSIITTTGYVTADFDMWPSFSKTILVMLMFIGACAGSTGGGIKVSRILILLKSVKKEIRISAHPRSTHKITMNGRAVEHETIRSVNVFIAVYLVIYAVSTLIISLDNLGFATNFTAVAATINNIGPGLEAVGPTQNFSVYSPLSTFVLTVDMWIGRLEIFPILMLISPYTWKK